MDPRIELDKSSVYKRDIVRAGALSQKAVSFAMPGVEPGAIVEYRWKQIEDDNRFRYLRLRFQRDLPVRSVTYFVRPLSGEITREQLYLMPFNCRPSPIKTGTDGFAATTVENVPAARTEPFAPSEPNLEPWALLYYRDGAVKPPDKYWSEAGRTLFQDVRDAAKSSDEIKSAASSALSGATTDDEKVAALVLWVRKNVHNVFDSETTGAEREDYFRKLPKDRPRTSAEIVRGGIGTPREMNIVLIALATAAGLGARPALVADRNEITFSPAATMDTYFLDNLAVAVPAGNSWKLVDASSKLLFPGMLPWREEGAGALIGDPKSPLVFRTGNAPPEASTEVRTAHLQLTAGGALTGDVEEVVSGHRAEDYRTELERESASRREEWLRSRVTRMFPDAEVTGIALQNVDDPVKPLVVRYHLDADRFAQVTGKRLLFQPNAFRRGQASPFTSSDRRFPVVFPYAWKESDQISIRLPEGFDLDNPDAPGSLAFGAPGAYTVKMTIRKDKSVELTTYRELTFGNQGTLAFEPQSYTQLKKIFDEIQLRDGHTVSLKSN